jgi:hemolysin D
MSNRQKAAGPGSGIPKQPVDPIVRDYQSDAVALELAPLPRRARTTLYLVVGLFVAMAIWAAFAELDRIVSATGRLVTRSPLVVVQAIETSTVKAFTVRVGDQVKAGDQLVRLDPTAPDADRVAMDAEKIALQARIERIEAELAGRTSVTFSIAGAPDLIAMEARIFRLRQDEFIARNDALTSKIAETKRELDGVGASIPIAERRLKLIGEVQGIRRELYDRRVGSRVALIDKEIEQGRVEQELQSMLDRRAVLTEALASATATRAAYLTERARALGEELVESRRRLDRATADAVKAQRRAELVSLDAPVDAIVLERAQLSEGSVVQTGSPLLTLVPADAELEVEIAIPARDIGWMKVGDLVRVKLEPFPFQKYDVIAGRIRTIAPDTSRPKEREQPGAPPPPPMFIAYVTLDADSLKRFAARDALVPGMNLTGEIQIGTRTVLSYLAYPILRTLDESLREPR